MTSSIGRMNRRIEIQEFTNSYDALNQKIKTYSKLTDLWCAIITDGLKAESQEVKQRVGYDQITFQIRYRTDITMEHRIVYKGNDYDIKAISEIDGKDRRLNLLAVHRDNE